MRNGDCRLAAAALEKWIGLTSYGVISWIVALAVTENIKGMVRGLSKNAKVENCNKEVRFQEDVEINVILQVAVYQHARSVRNGGSFTSIYGATKSEHASSTALVTQVSESSSSSSQSQEALSQAITSLGRIMHDTQTQTLAGIQTALESYSQHAGAAELYKLVKAPKRFAPSTREKKKNIS